MNETVPFEVVYRLQVNVRYGLGSGHINVAIRKMTILDFRLTSRS